jgi:hypothetical protein
MKRINSFATILLIAAMPILFTSCDDDDWDYYDYYGDWYNNYNWYNDSFDYGTSTLNAEAQCLRGHWTGTLNGIANGQNNNEALAFDLTRTTLAKPSSRAIVKSDTSTVAMKFRKR